MSCPFVKSGKVYDKVRASLLARSPVAPTETPCLQFLIVDRVRTFQEELQQIPKQEYLPAGPPGRVPNKAAGPATDEENAAEAKKRAHAHDILSDPRIRMS